jgi:cytochrome P450
MTTYPRDLDQAHLETLTTVILIFILVGVQTTSDAVTYVLYSLLQHPEYLQELRDEQEEALAAEGITSSPAIYTPEVYRHLEKLDSFIHESLRRRMSGIGLAHTNISKNNILLRSGTIVKPGI